MDKEILEIFGKIAGIGGLSLGVMLLIFRDFLAKKIFSTLTKEQSFKLLRLLLILTWSIAIVGISAYIYNIYANAKAKDSSSSLSKVVIMDSPLRDVVYDINSWKLGSTNADEITEILDDIEGLSLVKETTSLLWNREDQVISQNPDLIIIHASCFYDQTNIEDGDRKFFSFLEYLKNTKIKLLIYSRGFHHRDIWLSNLIQAIPELKGKVRTLEVPKGTTFKDPQIRRKIKMSVNEILNLEEV